MSRAFEEFERMGWRARSPTYDDGFGLLAAGAHPAMLHRLRLSAGALLVDVGCGTGRLLEAARGLGARAVGVDAVREMATAVRPPAVYAALPRLPFPDAVFDAAAAAFVVNHVVEPPAALVELARVVRPGGGLVVSVWDDDAHNRALGVVTDALARAGTTVTAVPDGPSSSSYAAPEPLAALLSGAGLVDVRVERVAWTHRVAPHRWWDDLLGGTVRTSAVVAAQDPATVSRVRAAFHRALTPSVGIDRIAALPASALVAAGARPC